MSCCRFALATYSDSIQANKDLFNFYGQKENNQKAK